MMKYEAMVLSCMDPRFQPKVFKYLKAKKFWKNTVYKRQLN